MALTGYADEPSSDDGNMEMSEIETKQESAGAEQEDSQSTGIKLNASNLEEHNKHIMGEKIQECHNLGRDPVIDADSETQTKVGAGLLFGLSGLLLGGPIIGLLAGAGATYVASNDEGPAGEAARATGEFAVTAGSKVGEAAKEANEEHGVLDKIKKAFSHGWGKVQELDKDGKMGEKARETVHGAKQKTVEFEQKHHVMENLLTGIQHGVNFLLEKVRDVTSETCSGNTSNSKSSS